MNSDGFAHTASALGSSISTFPRRLAARQWSAPAIRGNALARLEFGIACSGSCFPDSARRSSRNESLRLLLSLRGADARRDRRPMIPRLRSLAVIGLFAAVQNRRGVRPRRSDSDFRAAVSPALRCVPLGDARAQRVRQCISRSRLPLAACGYPPRHDDRRAALSARVREGSAGRQPAVHPRRRRCCRMRTSGRSPRSCTTTSVRGGGPSGLYIGYLSKFSERIKHAGSRRAVRGTIAAFAPDSGSTTCNRTGTNRRKVGLNDLLLTRAAHGHRHSAHVREDAGRVHRCDR